MLARVLVTEPRALVLDEPTSGLDLAARHAFMERVRGVARQGTTVILVTHHLEEIIPEIERVVLLRAGRIAGDGRKAEMLGSARLSELFDLPVAVDLRRRLSLRPPATLRAADMTSPTPRRVRRTELGSGPGRPTGRQRHARPGRPAGTPARLGRQPAGRPTGRLRPRHPAAARRALRRVPQRDQAQGRPRPRHLRRHPRGRQGRPDRPARAAAPTACWSSACAGGDEEPMPKDEDPLPDAEIALDRPLDRRRRPGDARRAGRAGAVGGAAHAGAARPCRPSRGRRGASRSIGSSPTTCAAHGQAEPAADRRRAVRAAGLPRLWGLLPTPEQLQAFLADRAPDKRAQLVADAARRRRRATPSTGSRSGTTCCATRTASPTSRRTPAARASRRGCCARCRTNLPLRPVRRRR